MFQRRQTNFWRSAVWGIAALLAATLAACATNSNAPAAPPLQLAADWQAHSAPLFPYPGRVHPGNNSWEVPGILPPGTYELISRHGDTAEVIDGYRFVIESAAIEKIFLYVPSEYTEVEAVPEKYVLQPAKHVKAE